MPSFCLIVGCSNDKKRRPDLSFCRVPKVITSQGEQTEILSNERRTRWLAAISRDDLTESKLENDRVCGIHFHSGKAASLWDKFNLDWVPSLHLGHSKLKSSDQQEKQQERAQRVRERRKREREREEQVPADFASRGGHVEEADLWWHGSRWLGSPDLWPADVLNEPSEESQTEATLAQKVLGVAVNAENVVEEVLHKFQLQKAVRICAWMRRFAHNSLRSRGTSRVLGPLTTEETNSQRLFWEKQAQKNCDIERDRVALNLYPNQDGILECRG